MLLAHPHHNSTLSLSQLNTTMAGKVKKVKVEVEKIQLGPVVSPVTGPFDLYPCLDPSHPPDPA